MLTPGMRILWVYILAKTSRLFAGFRKGSTRPTRYLGPTISVDVKPVPDPEFVIRMPVPGPFWITRVPIADVPDGAVTLTSPPVPLPVFVISRPTPGPEC